MIIHPAPFDGGKAAIEARRPRSAHRRTPSIEKAGVAKAVIDQTPSERSIDDADTHLNDEPEPSKGNMIGDIRPLINIKV